MSTYTARDGAVRHNGDAVLNLAGAGAAEAVARLLEDEYLKTAEMIADLIRSELLIRSAGNGGVIQGLRIALSYALHCPGDMLKADAFVSRDPAWEAL
jgi:hypothetical protein